MPTIVANGATELASSEFTLAQGETTTLIITTAAGGDPPQGATATVQIKTVDLQWMNMGALGSTSGTRLLTGPGTYRVVRRAGGTAYGVDRA